MSFRRPTFFLSCCRATLFLLANLYPTIHMHHIVWLGRLAVRTSDSIATCRHRFASRSRHRLVISEIGDRLWWVNYLGCNHETITQINSALHPSGTAKSSRGLPASAGVKAGSHRCRVTGNTMWACGMWFPVAVRWFPRTDILAV